MATDPRAGQMVTLPQASVRVGKPSGYFTIRRQRYKDHPEYPFPEPVTEIGGHLAFDLQTLLVWDEVRRQRDAAQRAAWEANRQTKETN